MFFYVNCHLISKLQVLGSHGEKVLEPALKMGGNRKLTSVTQNGMILTLLWRKSAFFVWLVGVAIRKDFIQQIHCFFLWFIVYVDVDL